MSHVTQRVQDVLKNGPRHRFTIVTAPALEGRANEILDAANAHSGRVSLLTAPAQESQQLDSQRQIEMIEDLRNQLHEFIPQEVDTGHVHHFLIDVAGVAAGEAGAQATLKALVSASIKDSRSVVAAVLPLSGEETPQDTATKFAVAGALEDYGLEPFTSLEAYTRYLTRL